MPRDFELEAQLATLELKVDIARAVQEVKDNAADTGADAKSRSRNRRFADSEKSGEGNYPCEKSTPFP